ncbi:toll-like receptor 2 [Leucoraja erinacea]|uniref:toll-like receptor 2 n=1 Tax=Leucoraja erinaceus TaxID=7782 RepID=UPI002454D81D|nr:toll-like receptor 2 [Leucoraja erinacea]
MSSQSLCFLLAYMFVCAIFFEDDGLYNTCQISDSESNSNCSSMKLTNVPRVSAETLIFDLSYNSISQIMETDFIIYRELRSLLLQSNQIQSIADQAFQLNTEIEYLDLSENLLTKLTANWFKHFSKLHYLNLLGNRYTTLGPGRLFANLSQLRWLIFGNPFLSRLQKDDFVGIPHLDECILTATNLDSYQRGAFSSFRSIGHIALGLQNMFLNKTDQAHQILIDLSGFTTHLEIRDLTFSDKGNNQILPVARNLSFVKLTIANCSINDHTAIAFVKSMTHTKLSDVVVKNCVLSGTGYWRELNIGVQSRQRQSLTLDNISIKNFYKFHELSSIGPLLENLITAIMTRLNMVMMPCHISKQLKLAEHLDLTHNLLSDGIMTETVCLGAWPSVRYLSLRNNLFKSLSRISPKLSTLSTLTHLDLSQNSFTGKSATCKWSKNLQFLNLSSCKIQSISQCLPPNVEVLDLSNNVLSSFDVSLPSLKILDVSNNKFKMLPTDSSLPKMAILNISNNELISLTEEEIKSFKNLESLQAGKNNYICSCKFLLYMKQSKMVQLLEQPGNYICDSPLTHRGQVVQNAKRSFFDCHMILSVVLLCASVSLATMITVFTCYKYHGIWYLQMTWAWLQAKRKPKKVRTNDTCYDAFVSYSQMDSDWVETLLVRELESVQPPLALCLHKRDFVPGKWIIDNIIESIEKSRKTLFVLSQHFVQSEWCKYELDYTHFRLFDENNDAAILVLLETIPKETIPQRFCKLRKLMNTKTYLEWPQDEEEQQMFWFNLKVALKGDVNITDL